MQRTVRIVLPVTGEPSATLATFLGEPVRWLPEGRLGGRGRLSTVRAGGIGRTILARVGSPWVVGSTHWRSLRWDPLNADGTGRADRWLPAFEGEVGLHVVATGRMTLILGGRYVPPGGSVGAAIDGAALGRIAQKSLERFLQDLATCLQAAAPMNAPVIGA